MNSIYLLWAARDGQRAAHAKCRAFAWALEGDEVMTRLWLEFHAECQASAREFLHAARFGFGPVCPHYRQSNVNTRHN